MSRVNWIADDALYGPDTVAARVVNESVLLLGGPRALLMQIAHPAVAAGVADHSHFEADPFGRLVRTLDAMTTISFGSAEEAAAVLEGLRRVHRSVAGTLADGSPYSATTPELLLWVHATLVDTVIEVERRYLGILDRGDRARFYDESKRLAAAFDIPSDLVPADLDAFRSYMDAQVAEIEISPTGRDLARSILAPPIPLVAAPLWEPLRLLTVDMLPRPFRDGYGLRWDRNRKRLARASQVMSRALLPRVPAPVRNFPSTARRTLARAG